jgi:hypothetical protein
LLHVSSLPECLAVLWQQQRIVGMQVDGVQLPERCDIIRVLLRQRAAKPYKVDQWYLT